MIILGITHPISWNTGACLLIDGKLVAMVEEERFTRIKFSPRMFPHQSVAFCLEQAGITLNDVDYIGIGFDHILKSVLPNLKGQPFYYGVLAAGYMTLFNTSDLLKIPKEIYKKHPYFINHHVSHINSAFYCSDFDEANVISFDGTGGGNSGILGFIKGIKLNIYKTISNSDSWGNMYSTITKLLGFKPHSDEYKVMGLASFGTPDPKGLPFIEWDSDFPSINRSKYRNFRNQLKRIVNLDNLMDKVNQDIAATAQDSLEKVALRYLEILEKKTKSRNLCVSGGVALNCSMNRKLLQSGLINNISIHPSSWDGGTALGAAMQVYIYKTGKRPDVGFNHPYWGPEYKDDKIKSTILKFGVRKYRYSDDVCKEGAKLLAENKVIGWFQGRLEVGPRALGNRSLLGNPSNPAMKDLINTKVKGREPWRPFAPSMMIEYAHEYIEDYYPAPYMLLTFKVKKDKFREICSAAHVDNTCRPQVVTKESNYIYWNLINEFRKLTGVPVILNTSFNLTGEPIVCTPEDAIRSFYRCGMDSLVIGNYIIEKTENDYSGKPLLYHQ